MGSQALDKSEILSKAKYNWDNKPNAKKIRAGSKYNRFLNSFKFPINDWENNFDNLTKQQQNILLKGELIRTYDSYPNIIKTNIMRKFGLSSFHSKWYKLPSEDKKILLNYVIR